MHCSTPTTRALLVALLLTLQLLVPAAVATPVATDEHALLRRDPQFASDWFSRMFPWGNRNTGSGTPSSSAVTTKSVISAGERAQLVIVAKCTKEVTVFRTPINGIKGYMGVNDNLRSLVVVFRGTVEPANIAADANGMPNANGMPAVAILAALDLHAVFPSAKVAVTTFGRRWASCLAARAERGVAGDDALI
ncbi:hypothetical protein AMAG_18973 [Allomyces macrogynus ATCC 38327]|uniref:Uncharacterized protein n=1 Tax=Allomyces macrogynus (strain ATCC 38327) TaxID=578462 RepID=A0A0L0SL47_ALLM3|nr:hypothetical protein AMAG_18973 [Allomyces macrogynus ATCC 38327]|eukprot:KNE63242.1 hypothetical protein AMAG_18973 [Allomyces macrogynus ATCC 38327]